MADIRAWVSYMGVGWCGEVADAEAALEHSSQAVRYLLVGKDDCVRKATKVRHCHHNQCQQHSQQDDAQAPGQQSVRKADKVEGSNLLSTPMPFPAVVKQARSEASCSPMARRCLRWRRALTSRRTCGACAAA